MVRLVSRRVFASSVCFPKFNDVTFVGEGSNCEAGCIVTNCVQSHFLSIEADSSLHEPKLLDYGRSLLLLIEDNGCDPVTSFGQIP